MTNNEITKAYLGSEEVTKIYQGNTVVWEQSSGSPTPDYSTIPFTIKAKNSGTIQMIGNSGVGFYYLINNNGEWVYAEFSNGSTPPTFTLNEGDYIQFKGTNNNGVDNRRFTYSNGFQFDAYGNIMSLVNKDTYDTIYLTTVKSFEKFFENSGVISAENLILPLVVGYGSYQYMFNNCSSLTTAPELPATTLAVSCYNNMFQGCTSLTKAPSSIGTSATTMAASACTSMFSGCTSLETAPELPATTLAPSCYQQMFGGCTSLTTAPELPATTLAPSCYREMFWNCTSLTTAPELPATTLVYGCYNNMFRDCSNLNYIKCLATDISASKCVTNWVNSVQTTSGTFVTPSTTNWSTGTSGIPSGWTRVDV